MFLYEQQAIWPQKAPFGHRWRWGVYLLLGVIVLGILAFATLKPIRVLPRIRLAPGFALLDHTGQQVSSEDLRGTVVLYTFTYSRCRTEACQELWDILRYVDRHITEAVTGGVPFRLAVISFDPTYDTPERLRQFREAYHIPARWLLLTGTDANRLRYVIGGGFEVYYEPLPNGEFAFDPAFILVDGWGIIRGEYRYETLMPQQERLVRHLNVLFAEIRNSRGAAKVAYEAAHLFLCYAR